MKNSSNENLSEQSTEYEPFSDDEIQEKENCKEKIKLPDIKQKNNQEIKINFNEKKICKKKLLRIISRR